MSAGPDWAWLNVKGIKFLRTNKACQAAADVHSQHFKGKAGQLIVLLWLMWRQGEPEVDAPAASQ